MHNHNFRLFFGADQEQVHNWWVSFKATEEGRDFFELRPDLDARFHRDGLRKLLPGSFHLDAGPVSKTGSAEIITWGSILGTGNDFQRRFLTGTWLKCNHNEHQNKFWPAFFESMDLLEAGVLWPGGPQFAEGWALVVVDGKADLEEICVQVGLRSYNGAPHMCSLCNADRGGTPWTDFHPDAACRTTVMNQHQFCRLLAGVGLADISSMLRVRISGAWMLRSQSSSQWVWDFGGQDDEFGVQM